MFNFLKNHHFRGTSFIQIFGQTEPNSNYGMRIVPQGRLYFQATLVFDRAKPPPIRTYFLCKIKHFIHSIPSKTPTSTTIWNKSDNLKEKTNAVEKTTHIKNQQTCGLHRFLYIFLEKHGCLVVNVVLLSEEMGSRTWPTNWRCPWPLRSFATPQSRGWPIQWQGGWWLSGGPWKLLIIMIRTLMMYSQCHNV